MIQPLRTVHRRAFVALAVLLPAILVVGLTARRPRWHPGAIVSQLPATAHLIRKSDGLWRKHAIETEFYRDSNASQDNYVVLLPPQDLNEPDLLLYWAATEPQGNSLPPQAQLVGVFAAGKTLKLPSNSARAGRLVMYSLAHQAVVDTAAVEKLP
jgi:hypothetical protein